MNINQNKIEADALEEITKKYKSVYDGEGFEDTCSIAGEKTKMIINNDGKKNYIY